MILPEKILSKHRTYTPVVGGVKNFLEAGGINMVGECTSLKVNTVTKLKDERMIIRRLPRLHRFSSKGRVLVVFSKRNLRNLRNLWMVS